MKSNVLKNKCLINRPLNGVERLHELIWDLHLNTEVIQIIVKSVLNQSEFRKYSDIFSKVDWDHFEQVARAYKKLIEILEQEHRTR